MFIARAMCEVTSVKSSCLLLQFESAEYLEWWRGALNAAGRSVSVITMRPTITRLELHTFSLVTALFTVYAQ